MRRLIAILLSLILFQSAQALRAAVRYRKEAVPQLSSEQYERIRTLQPDPQKPVYVVLKVSVIRGDVTKVEVVESCGVPDVDRTVASWVWKTYHYKRDLSGVKSEKVRVNGPIARSPQVRVSWRALQELQKADPLRAGKLFISRFNIVIQQGKIVDVQLVQSCGLPLIDQESRDFIRKNWIAVEGANQNFITSVRFHRGYYPE